MWGSIFVSNLADDGGGLVGVFRDSPCLTACKPFLVGTGSGSETGTNREGGRVGGWAAPEAARLELVRYDWDWGVFDSCQ